MKISIKQNTFLVSTCVSLASPVAVQTITSPKNKPGLTKPRKHNNNHVLATNLATWFSTMCDTIVFSGGNFDI